MHRAKILRRPLQRFSHTDPPGGQWARALQSAEQRSDADAVYFVGRALLLGEDGAPAKDARAGKAWLRTAAEMGHAPAQATLGRAVYEEMEALREQAHVHDYQAAAEAERWLTRAYEQGERDAARTLVPLYVARGDLAAALRMMVSRWASR
uniref:Sel1 repeat family protein n=1 Tax=Prymnesium polylepis TaxID=72548 RepID=A0A6T8CUA8_9EUKA|mmetsp:Transcript_6762/g.17718  ORF Transcript_6762/g.17718 Transcript_6762/m.17718 type:complete len:151 (-) Transcript_6762:96-548(-)